MNRRRLQRRGQGAAPLLALALSALLLATGCIPPESVMPVYLTWSRVDTTSSITVQYHTRGPSQGSHVHYDREPRGGDPADYAQHAEGFEKRRPGVDRTVHVVELSGLEPGGTYWFVVGDPVSGYREERSFRRPSREGRLTFVAGGDMGTGFLSRMISARAAAESPSFAAIGGDLAYAYGANKHLDRWWRWFADWEASMRTPEGHLVPMVLAVGNHELRDDSGSFPPEERGPFYRFFFQQGEDGASYFERRVGPVVLWVLDSGHLASHAEQRAWLDQRFRINSRVPFRFAVYHVPLYPAHHDFEARASQRGREHWLPLFDRFRLTAGFENHDHLQKRTHSLRAGQVVGEDEGTLYLGGGLWGKGHPEEPETQPYLARTLRRRHFWRVTLEGNEVRYTAIGADGQVLDTAVQRVGRRGS
jgi:hypothetical protein